MNILTNIKFVRLAGMAQSVFSFIDFVEKERKSGIKIVAVDVIDYKKSGGYRKEKKGRTSFVSLCAKTPIIRKVIKRSENLEEVKNQYKEVINGYSLAIEKEKPDLILVNGTYYLPWCLLLAGFSARIPMVLHYHGILSKETERWDKKSRRIFKEMEKSFDQESLFYIFPSELTKNVVEKEVFKHKVEKYSILPNSVPLHFFKTRAHNNKKNIGIVTRWADVKNTEFCLKLARYNKSKGFPFRINIITDLKKNDARRNQLSQLVAFKRPLENKNLNVFYEKMGVVISPSHFETYGNVAKESLAAGTPALVSSNMGVSEVFQKLGLGGWVINFNSVDEVYEKIKNVIQHNVSEDIRMKIRETYSPQTVYGKMINVLNSAT